MPVHQGFAGMVRIPRNCILETMESARAAHKVLGTAIDMLSAVLAQFVTLKTYLEESWVGTSHAAQVVINGIDNTHQIFEDCKGDLENARDSVASIIASPAMSAIQHMDHYDPSLEVFRAAFP